MTGAPVPAGGPTPFLRQHRLSRVGEQVDQHGAQLLAVGLDASARRVELGRRPADRLAAAAATALTASRHSALMSVGDASKRIGRAKSSTSLTTRLSRSISPSMSAAASRMSAAVAPSRVSCRSAPLMIISGLRISCATIVDMRPSDDSRSRCAASRWKRAIESVSVLNVVASSRASSSCQPTNR